MASAEKTAAIAELADNFRNSGAAVLTEYRGLTVKQLTELRNSLREHATYAVVKNTLTERAAKEAGVTAFDGQLKGPSAIAFVTGDAVEAAKGLRDFARTHPLLVIKAAVLDGKAVTPDEVRQLADLESREVLLARLAGAMNASLSRAVYLFAAPLSQAVRLIDALRDKVEAEGPVAAPEDAPNPADDATQDAVDTPQDAPADVPAGAAPTEDVAAVATEAPTDGGES